jgi:two-component system nitrate/nitrite response regulator NarL
MAENPRPSVRVLVVDDYEAFRRFVFSELGKRAELQVIGEASEGLEAVQKAADLQPDLIILDVGLPTLNGIEAAKRIHEIIPDAKILFLTQNSDTDVIRAALSNGAKGYVLKLDANKQLLHAVEAVLQGDRFVSVSVNHGDASPSLS